MKRQVGTRKHANMRRSAPSARSDNCAKRQRGPQYPRHTGKGQIYGTIMRASTLDDFFSMFKCIHTINDLSLKLDDLKGKKNTSETCKIM